MKESLQAKSKDLAGLKIFQGFPHDLLEELCMMCNVKQYKKGEQIFAQGEKGDAMYIILNGKVDIIRKERGVEIHLATLGKGDFFGEMDVLAPQRQGRSASAIASTNVTALRVGKKEIMKSLRDLKQSALKFLLTILQVVIQRLRNMDRAYTKLFLECRGKERTDELKSLREKLLREWKI